MMHTRCRLASPLCCATFVVSACSGNATVPQQAKTSSSVSDSAVSDKEINASASDTDVEATQGKANHKSPSPTCQYSELLPLGRLRLKTSGEEFVSLRDTPVRASLDSPTVLQVETETAEGWHLWGWIDSSEDEPLHASKLLRLSSFLAITSHAPVKVTELRVGKVLIEPSASAFLESEGFTFLSPKSGWVSCTDLSLNYSFDVDSPEQFSELEVPPSAPTMYILSGTETSLSETPGGKPVLTISVRVFPDTVRVIDSMGEFRRVVLLHWSGAALIGWVPNAALSRNYRRGDRGGMRARRKRKPSQLCTVLERTPLWVATKKGKPEEAGWVDRDTIVELLALDPDGVAHVKPYNTSKIHSVGGQVDWQLHTPLGCDK